jgi:hypothetical protein
MADKTGPCGYLPGDAEDYHRAHCTDSRYWMERALKAEAATPAPASERELREIIARMRLAVRWHKGIAPLVVEGWADELERLLTREGQPKEGK